MSRAPARVEAVLLEAGVEVDVRTFPQGTRTAEDAAAAIGVEVGQIVKSLVFAISDPHPPAPVLALVSGANRADEALLAEAFGGEVGRAGADDVRAWTGFSIGGIPPVGHARPVETVVDEDLLRFAVVWAAAGTPTDVFAIAPDDLVRVTNGRVVRLRSG